VDGQKINCIAREIRSCHWKESPQLTNPPNIIQNNLYNGEVEVFTDGSVRYHHDVATRVLTPPHGIKQPVYAQGGLLFHFKQLSEIYERSKNITITGKWDRY